LYIPNVLPPLKTVANGYEYYSTTSTYGMVYLRKKLSEGRDAPEVIFIKEEQVRFTHHFHCSKCY
jgi:oligopeptidase B